MAARARNPADQSDCDAAEPCRESPPNSREAHLERECEEIGEGQANHVEADQVDDRACHGPPHTAQEPRTYDLDAVRDLERTCDWQERRGECDGGHVGRV